MKLTSPIRLSDDVVTRQVGDDFVLLHIATGTYFGLDPIGGQFISLIEKGFTAAAARDALLAEYDVTPDVLDRDLEALLVELEANAIIQVKG